MTTSSVIESPEQLGTDASASTYLTPSELDLELASQREHRDALSAEWNELFRKQGDVAKRLRAAGELVEKLERQKYGLAVPDYNPEGGAR